MASQQRAYALFHVKAIDDEQRIIEGVASTPTLDRQGDSMDPAGAKFRLPIPLLWQHQHDKPIGYVIAAQVTPDGIQIKAQIARGVLPFIEDAWALIKSRLVRGLSIGWLPLEQPKVEKGVYKYGSWEWFELSAVTIPANAEASILAVKAADAPHLALSGIGEPSVPSTSPAVVGPVAVKAIKPAAGRTMKKTITDQIKEFENTRAAKVAERDQIMDEASEKGLTLDAAQTEAYDALDGEIKSIDEHLVRLRARDEENRKAAVAVAGATQAEASASRGLSPVVVMGKVNRDPGVGFARVALAKAAAFLALKNGQIVSALDIAMKRWPSDTEVHTHIKTNIPAGTTTDANWATELVEPTTLGSEFLEFLRAQTIIGKFGQGGVPALRSLPFNIRIGRMTSGLTGNWVGEGLAKPASKGAVDAVTLPYHKVAALSVITQELARFSTPSAERLVRDELAAACSARIDSDFVDPAISATSARPASITNGLTALSSAGTTADNARTDIMNLLEYFILNHMSVSQVVLLMPNTLALALSILRNSLGQQEFPGLTLNGGTLEGIPVVTSQYLANTSSYGNMVVALDASTVGIADDGAVDIKVSDQATIEMTDTPAGDATTPTAGSTAYVSMFQTNSLAILAERFITWKKLRTTSVVFMDDVNWGAIGSPA